MKLQPERLAGHLAKTIAPIYVVSGDEALLVQEACDEIRRRACASGYTDRSVWYVESGFDWDGWFAASHNQSLFAERQLIELRLPSGKPGDAGSKALAAYASRPNDDNLLLITTGKLDGAAQKSRWLQALTDVAVHVVVWPLTPAQLPGWLKRRMADKGMSVTAEAISVLVERVEGNPLAAAQEIEKLYLLHGAGVIDETAVEAAVVDNARFDVYGLVDCAAEGDSRRVLRVLARLRDEGVEPPIVLWALTREIRSLAEMAAGVASGVKVDRVVAQYRVWEKRKPLIKKALGRHTAANWCFMLRCAATADRVIKGELAGNSWDELLKLSLRMAGTTLFKREARL